MERKISERPTSQTDPPRVSSSPRVIRIGVPVAISVFGVWLLTGCVYLPIPEHGSDWVHRDFRRFLDPKNLSSPIRPGKTSRAKIAKLLGRPEFEISADRAVVYRFDTERDGVIWPLCFLVQPGYRDSYAVKFSFDDKNQLTGWITAHHEGLHGGGAISSPIISHPDATAEFRPN